MHFGKVIIGGERSGGTENTGGFEVISHETSETKSRITGGVLLKIGGIVGFVDNNEAEIREGGEKGRARPDNDNRGGGLKTLLPNLVALGFSLTGVDDDSAAGEGSFKNLDELGCESDFGH